MLKSIEVSGKTEEEAIQAALDQLGLQRDEVSVEIVERAKRIPRLKSTPAVVRVTYESDISVSERIEKIPDGLIPPHGRSRET